MQTFSSLGGLKSSWKSLKPWETGTINAKASCTQIPLRRVSACLSCTSVVRAGNQWLVCHTQQQKQCQHVQIEKAALAPVHRCKISLLYLWEASAS